MIGQDTETRGQLGYSKGTLLGKHNYNCMKALLGKVSHKALDIMADEIVRLDQKLKKQVKKCGCKVRFSCGLPCACKIAEYMQRGTRIQPEVIDPFWRKLDLTPSTCLPGNDHLKDGDDIEAIHEVVGDLTSFLVEQPKAQRKHWLSKIKDMFKPGNTQVEDPFVQKSTRRRPVGSKQKAPKVPDLNKNPPGLRKSKSSRPRAEEVPMTPPFTDPSSGASTYGEVQPARRSEYAHTKSRFANTPDFFDELQGARHSMYDPTQNFFREPSQSYGVNDTQNFFGESSQSFGKNIYTFGEPSQSYGVQNLYSFGETSKSYGLQSDQPYYSFVDNLFRAPPTQPTYAPIYETMDRPESEPEPESEASWVGHVAEPMNARLSRSYLWALPELPEYIRPYVVGAQDVLGDGSCGFRATAVALGLDENHGSEWVRMQMLEEFESDLEGYMRMYGDDDLEGYMRMLYYEW